MQAGERALNGVRVQLLGERRLDILNDPIQWLRGQLIWLNEGHHGAIDWYISRLSGAALTPEQRLGLLCIQSGGLWTPRALKVAGLADEDTCPWCRAGIEDLRTTGGNAPL